MRERPILFSDEMVRAILDGRKTQTRRLVKPITADQAVGYIRSCLLDTEDLRALVRACAATERQSEVRRG